MEGLTDESLRITRRSMGTDQGFSAWPGGSCWRNGGGQSSLFIEAVIYRYRAGIPWRDLPERFGGWKNTHQRFRRWCESGVFERIFKMLAEDSDNEYMMLDSSIVRAHQHSAGARKKTEPAKPSADHEED